MRATELDAAPASGEEVENAAEEIAPELDPDLLRKYIAYARHNCFPTMTDEAMETIKGFYGDLRSKGTNEDVPMPVSARKLEELVRLADEVTEADAERAVEIVRSCLRDLGVDPERGSSTPMW